MAETFQSLQPFCLTRQTASVFFLSRESDGGARSLHGDECARPLQNNGTAKLQACSPYIIPF